MYVHDTKVDAYIYILLFLCKTSSIFLNIYNQMMFVLFDRTSRIAKPCSQKKSHEHGTNQSTHPSFMETCHQSGKSTIDFAENQPPTLGKSATKSVELRKSVTVFGKNRHLIWGNPSSILGKSVTEFGEIHYRFWGNPSPSLGKSATDFGKIGNRLWENLSLTLRKSVTDFGKMSHRL